MLNTFVVALAATGLILFFRKKVCKKLVTVPVCHKAFPFLLLAIRQGDLI